MLVSECMTREVRITSPEATIQEAARMMKDTDAGVIPVGENDRLVGMVTDRDIAIRAVAEGCDGSTQVRKVMTTDLQWAFEDEEIGDVAQRMSEAKVRRMPVLNRDKRLTGILSLGDIARGADGDAATALAGASRPGGPHSQAQA